MADSNKITFTAAVSQIAGNVLLLIEEGLSRLYPREPRKKLSEENFRFNRGQDIVNTVINDQSTGFETGINKLKIGKASVGDCGCEIIAVYNALCLMGKECSFAKVERDFELNGALTKVPFVPIGAYGSNPYALKRMVEMEGLKGKYVRWKELICTPGTYIYSYWNDGGLMSGLHTIITEFDGEAFSLYNYGKMGVRIMDKEIWEKRFKKCFIIGLSVSDLEV
ncbi:MAG: hypothetical protein Q4D71_07650 [Oscillospiraceae bacterium]|nr:hypothetical protein [Oscillospiraceae bacterium]MDO5138318.1 hypothetical protein [Oscillospiraceae bacterium]